MNYYLAGHFHNDVDQYNDRFLQEGIWGRWKGDNPKLGIGDNFIIKII